MMQSRTRRPLPAGAFLFPSPSGGGQGGGRSSVEEEFREAVAMSGVRTVAGFRARLRLRALFRTARGRLRPGGRAGAGQPRVDREGTENHLALSRIAAGAER